MTEQTEILQQVLARVRTPSEQPPVVLLDLDDTIFSTSFRHVKILKEFTANQQRQQRHNGLLEKLAAVKPEHTRYYILETAKEAGVEDALLLEELKTFWFERFFKGSYLLEDRPVPGAPEFCRMLRGCGARLVYQTGRDETMRPATLESLDQNGFPIPDSKDVHLIVKPHFNDPDLEYKTRTIEQVRRFGPVAAAFENEPAHINLFHDHFPGGVMVLLETRHSGRVVELKSQIHRINNFLL